MASVELKKVVKNFGKVNVLKDLSLHVNDEEFFVLLGASGAGKSTTLDIISGLDTIDGGEILFDGSVVNNQGPIERGVSMVFQNYALYPHMTVYKNIAFPLKMLNYRKERIPEIVKEVAQKLDIIPLLDRYPKELSGGQAQRVALARSLVRNPKIFLLDEPLSNLDANIRSKIRNELKLMHKNLGKTFIYVTHDQLEAMSLADHMGILHNGVIEQVGRPIDIYRHPHNDYIASFLGDPEINMFSYTGNNGTYKSDDSPFIFKMENEHKKITVGIRPEDIYIKKENQDDIEGTVIPKTIELLGSHSLIIGETQSKKEIKIITYINGTDIDIGKPLKVFTNMENWNIFDENGTNINK